MDSRIYRLSLFVQLDLPLMDGEARERNYPVCCLAVQAFFSYHTPNVVATSQYLFILSQS